MYRVKFTYLEVVSQSIASIFINEDTYVRQRLQINLYREKKYANLIKITNTPVRLIINIKIKP